MSTADTHDFSVRCSPGLTSERPWIAAGDEFDIKVLSVDEPRKTVEFMGRIKAGYRSGNHLHTSETHLLVIEGRLKNHTTGVEFGPGDYCYQPKATCMTKKHWKILSFTAVTVRTPTT